MKIPKHVEAAFEAARKARDQAYAPYSKFRVGAALITKKGKVITGCNVENASYGATICAERVAILKAVSEGQDSFSDVVVVTDTKNPAYPCAQCLQVMAEFFPGGADVWVADTQKIHNKHKFSDLLPYPFGPKELKAAR